MYSTFLILPSSKPNRIILSIAEIFDNMYMFSSNVAIHVYVSRSQILTVLSQELDMMMLSMATTESTCLVCPVRVAVQWGADLSSLGGTPHGIKYT